MSRVPLWHYMGVVKAFDRNLFVPVNSEQEERKKVTLKLSQIKVLVEENVSFRRRGNVSDWIPVIRRNLQCFNAEITVKERWVARS